MNFNFYMDSTLTVTFHGWQFDRTMTFIEKRVFVVLNKIFFVFILATNVDYKIM